MFVPRHSTPTNLDPGGYQRAMQVNNFQDNDDLIDQFQQGIDDDDNDDGDGDGNDGNDEGQRPIPAAPVARPVSQWHAKEWNDALKTKEFTDFDDDDDDDDDGNDRRVPPSRCTIVKVLYDRRERAYVVDYVKIRDRPLARNVNQAVLQEVLELARREDWFIPAFEEYIRTRG